MSFLWAALYIWPLPWEWGKHTHIHRCKYTFPSRCGSRWERWDPYTGNTHFCITMWRSGADMGMRWTCIHALIHVSLMMKVLDRSEVVGTHTRIQSAHMFAHKCVNGCGTDMKSHMDMHTCTDAFAPLVKAFGPDEGWLRHAHWATQGSKCILQTGWVNQQVTNQQSLNVSLTQEWVSCHVPQIFQLVNPLVFNEQSEVTVGMVKTKPYWQVTKAISFCSMV